MKAEPARKRSEPARPKKREFKNTPLNETEKWRIHRLAIRFQDIIHERNQALKEVDKMARVELEDVDLMRAGLLRLEAIKDSNEFYLWVMKGRNRE